MLLSSAFAAYSRAFPGLEAPTKIDSLMLLDLQDGSVAGGSGSSQNFT
jgi:hypothetical protein